MHADRATLPTACAVATRNIRLSGHSLPLTAGKPDLPPAQGSNPSLNAVKPDLLPALGNNPSLTAVKPDLLPARADQGSGAAPSPCTILSWQMATVASKAWARATRSSTGSWLA